MSKVQAILFCGGRGTRLYPITDYYQKVMVPLGPEGRPMLEYVIRHLANNGIEDFVALIRYRANQIRRYFGDGSRFGVNIKYVLDDPNFSGTGGALYNARNEISADQLLIYYTDILSSINIKEMLNYHHEHEKSGTAWIDPSWKVKEGIVTKNEDDLVESIKRNPQEVINANTGISILNYSVFELMDDIIEDDGKLDLSGDVFSQLADTGEMIAYRSTDWWIDVGSLSRHQAIDHDKLHEKFEFGGKLNEMA